MSLESQLEKATINPAWMLFYLGYHTPKYANYQECFEAHFGAGKAYHQTGPWMGKAGPWMDDEEIAIKAHAMAKDDFEYDQQVGALEVNQVAMNHETQSDMIAETEADKNFVRWT
jgi:hypothetical protein